MQSRRMAVVYGNFIRVKCVNESSDGLENFLLLVSVEEPVELRLQQLETDIRSAIGIQRYRKFTLRRNAEANVTNMK